MNRATLARRYGPLLAVAAVQLLIIAVVPSRAPQAASEVESGQRDSALGPDSSGVGVIDPATGQVIDPATGQVIDPATGKPVTGQSGTTGNTSGTSGTGGGGGAVGDTSHCVKGRQYDPAIFEWAPPCVPKFTGNNGGSTYNRGVTKDTIKVIVMKGNYGEAVNKILEQQGTPSQAQMEDFTNAAEEFINKKYELYGRKIVMDVYQIKAITGGQDKPDDAALKEEMKQLVRDRNPFAVIWANSVSSETYRQLSQLKVVNIGGYGFTDDYNNENRPYHWDVQMGGYQLADQVSSWYCGRMYGGGSAKAEYAGTPTGGSFTDLHTKVRNLGIITTKDPENLKTANRVTALLKSKCGVTINHRYEYEQNIQTLQTQRTEAYQAMTSQTPVATSIMCFCDQVAPQFLYYTLGDNRYYPETLIVATGIMDLDRVGQSYDHGAEDQANPTRRATKDDGIYPVFENAFGLAQFPKQVSEAQSPGGRMWTAAGKSGIPPHKAADEDWNYYAMLAGMIQMAGPTLTPFTVETGAHKMGTVGNLTSEYSGQRSLGPGDYTWMDTLREFYWAPKTRSAFNNIQGSYTSLNGGKWFKGQFPGGLLSLPAKPRP